MKKIFIILLFLAIVGIVYIKWFDKFDQNDDLSNQAQPEIDSVHPEPAILYGIHVDSLLVVEDTVKPHQNLSEILLPYQVPYETIDRLAKASRDVFDVRKIVTDKKYTLICTEDSIPKALYFIYEPTPLEYYVYHFQDSICIYRSQREVDTVQQTISGVIQSSLYETMLTAGASPLLVNKLADVYAWQVDFFRIQKGDRFKVVYEVMQVDGKAVSLGRILAGFFQHRNRDFYAFYFNQKEGGTDYFDEEGNSLRKAFLKAPLNFTRISSRYSRRRFHPVQKRYKAHLGTDYAAPRGTPVRSVGDGVVVEARYSKYNGNYVKIKHNSVYTTQYLHMSKIAGGIRKGVPVTQGQTIGFVGSTGLATGSHLCFRFWKNGRQVDPFTVEIPPSEPILEQLKESFICARDDFKNRLDSIAYPEVSEEETLAKF